MMRYMMPIGALCMLSVGLTIPFGAVAARNQGSCGQIAAAREGAGFVRGAAREGAGLKVDCIHPSCRARRSRRAPAGLCHKSIRNWWRIAEQATRALANQGRRRKEVRSLRRNSRRHQPCAMTWEQPRCDRSRTLEARQLEPRLEGNDAKIVRHIGWGVGVGAGGTGRDRLGERHNARQHLRAYCGR
jgi:hypothetical protein